jgi:glutamate synthase (NADPH/NADH) small chain
VNLSLEKTKMPLLDIEQRQSSFCEVALGYSLEDAQLEANRCLECKHKPCVKACPVHIDIPKFIHEIKEKNYEEAYQVILNDSMLPAVCGRVCPQESQCEKTCVRGIKGESVAIGRLERYVADYHYENNPNGCEFEINENHHKIAIVGSGPAGLSCACQLLKLGYDITIFEALHTPGGVLVYGIPEFRLPKAIVQKEIDQLLDHSVKLKTNTVIGKTLYLEDLFTDGYEAVFIGTGAGLPQFLNIPGETLNGVYSANEFLTRVNLMKAYDKSYHTPIYKGHTVSVVGGGNVAMDAARAALRLGAKKVHIIYRRSMEELPARKEEIEHAIEENIDFNILTNPVEILGDEKGFVKSMKCLKMKLGEPDASGRRRPIPIKDSLFEMTTDVVIIAVGTTPNPMISQTASDLKTNEKGCIITKDESGLTTKAYVYAGGDAVTGAATVIEAMGAGKKSALAIHELLS